MWQSLLYPNFGDKIALPNQNIANGRRKEKLLSSKRSQTLGSKRYKQHFIVDFKIETILAPSDVEHDNHHQRICNLLFIKIYMNFYKVEARPHVH